MVQFSSLHDVLPSISINNAPLSSVSDNESIVNDIHEEKADLNRYCFVCCCQRIELYPTIALSLSLYIPCDHLRVASSGRNLVPIDSDIPTRTKVFRIELGCRIISSEGHPQG